jgi:4-amino-4-deoxy-L-arabinose transferase-like glycosyltransferase
MSAAFAAAMLIVMRGPRGMPDSATAGALLGLAIVAKGLVPLALFVPALWFLHRQIRQALVILGFAALIAVPWYVLVTLRNGAAFLDVFFVQQTFGRFASRELGHEQPFWFYVPVLLAGLFPWTPFLMLLFRKQPYRDSRAAFLLTWLIWGLVFFSLFLNKLPGYLLPLLPPLAALIGSAIAGATNRSILLLWSMSLSAALVCFIPSIEDVLPDALSSGLSRSHYQVPAFWMIPCLAAALLCSALARVGRRSVAIALIGLATTFTVIRLLWSVYPILDHTDSARQLSRSKSITCVRPADRSLRYGLNYYTNRELPDCN